MHNGGNNMQEGLVWELEVPSSNQLKDRTPEADDKFLPLIKVPFVWIFEKFVIIN